MNINLTIELKKEYMAQLTNIINPLIYTGLQSMYSDSVKNSKCQNILTDFQSRLIIIKDWSHSTIEQEVKRILDNTISIPWFLDLIQAVFKINQIILGLDDLIDINIKTFIYQIYIECSREFWMNPYLFYHEYTPLEMKHNTNMILTKITCCIENAIRRLLPMGIILDKFLGDKATNKKNFSINEIYNMPLLLSINLQTPPVNKIETGQIDINNIMEMFRNGSFGKKSTESFGNMENNTNFSIPCRRHDENIPHLESNKYYGVNNQIHDNTYKQLENKSLDIKNVVHDTIHNKPVYSNTSIDDKIQKNTDLHGGSLTTDTNTNNKILNIINKQNFKLSESHDNKKKSHKSDKGSDSSAILKKIINESINTNHTASTGLNSMVKNKLLKNLESDTINNKLNMAGNKKLVNSDSESVIRNPNEKYQDFFTNSEIKKDSLQNVDKNDNTKNKFFNNYLNI
jgi:hypothetical protein